MNVLSIPRDTVRATIAIGRFGAQATLLPARLMLEAAEFAAGKIADAIVGAGPEPAPPRPSSWSVASTSAPPSPARRTPRPARPRPSSPRSRAESVPLGPAADTDAYNGNGGPPSHVDEEATLVMESADAGAADGAGAEVRVAAPWPRYARMTAAEVIDRVAVESEPVLTVVLLYERSHRARRSVIEATERALSRLAGRQQPGPGR